MHILQATSEFFPYSKTGGLADMVAGLSNAISGQGHTITVVTPLYRGIRDVYTNLKPALGKLSIPMGKRVVPGRVFRTKPHPNLTVLFVDHPGYFNRLGIYMERGSGYADNAERFIFFSKATIEIARRLQIRPDIIHCHDWQTVLIPLLLQHAAGRGTGITLPGTCLSIHNLAYQGVCDARNFSLTNLPRRYFTPEGVEFYGQLNCLKAGLVYADQLITVSPQYAAEITTSSFGEGLDGVIRHRTASITGILNGVDYGQWKSTDNRHLKFDYSAENLTGKLRNKSQLLHEIGLPRKRRMPPLYSYIGRLADQKGVDLILDTLPFLLAKSKFQFVLLGSGTPYHENKFNQLQDAFPESVFCHLEYNESMAHRIEAAADFLVMPSKFEPCGLNQMYSLRYGTIPIVNAVGGLKDTVIDLAKHPRSGTGFVLTEFSPRGLMEAFRFSANLHTDLPRLNRVRKRAMKINFSWKQSSSAYLDIYRTC